MAFVESGSGGGNNKYLALKEGQYCLRLVGEDFKYLYHFKFGDTRRICTKTASNRDPNTQQRLVKNPETHLEYSDEQINSCPICALGDKDQKCRRRFAINVIDMQEKQNLATQGLPVNVRIMEFSNGIFEYFVAFQREHGFSPSDPSRAPVFYITAMFPPHKVKKMPDGTLKKDPKDIEYIVNFDPSHIDRCPLSPEDIAAIYNPQKPGIYDLTKEYNPFTQAKRSVFPQNTAVASLPSNGSPSQFAGFQQPAAGPAFNMQVPAQAPVGFPTGAPSFPVAGAPGAPIGYPNPAPVAAPQFAAPAPAFDPSQGFPAQAPQQFAAPQPPVAAPQFTAPAQAPAFDPSQGFPAQVPQQFAAPAPAFDPTQVPQAPAPTFDPTQMAPPVAAPQFTAPAQAPAFDPSQGFPAQAPQQFAAPAPVFNPTPVQTPQQFTAPTVAPAAYPTAAPTVVPGPTPAAAPEVAYQQPAGSNSDQLQALLSTIGNQPQ